MIDAMWLGSFHMLGDSSVLPLLAASAIACLTLALAGLRHRRGILARQDIPLAPEFEEILEFQPSLGAIRGERLDVATEARSVTAAMAPRAARRGVRLELAILPGLDVWMDRRAFRKLLADVILYGIAAAPCGRVLLTAASHGGRTQIGVSHDGPEEGREAVEAAIRPAMDLAALSGGSCEVRVRAGQGGTVLVRLPQPASSPLAGFVPPPARAESDTRAERARSLAS